MQRRHITSIGLVFSVFLFLASCNTPTVTPTAPTNTNTPQVMTATAATNEATLAATDSETESATAAPTLVTMSSTGSATGAAEATSGTTDAHRTTFVIADVSATPTSSIALLQPLADYLQEKLAPAGITSVTIKVAPDFDTIAAWLKDGEVDMLFQTPYPAVLLQNAVGAQPILRRWRDGDAEYYTVIFARADSGIKVLSDLKGKMLAVQDQFSTTAYMLPLSYILDSGIKIVQLTDPTATVPADMVGYTNSNGDDNTLQWVISGKVSAGATDFRSFEKIPAESRTQLVVLAQTEKVPRGVVVVRPGMDSAMLSTLKNILLAMDSSDEGKAVLTKIQKTTKFDELPGGPDAALARIKTLTKLLEEAVNK